MDLASAKGRDMERYYDTLGQLKESYSRCAMVSICVIVFFFSFVFGVDVSLLGVG